MAPPGSIPVYPFTNIGIFPNYWKEKEYVDIYTGDLFFIPCYWHHKVLTLEDNTFTINYTLYNDNNHLYATNRDIHMYGLHKYFNTSMCKTNKICNILHDKYNSNISILLGISEFSIYYIFYTIIFLLFLLYAPSLLIYFISSSIIIALYLIFDIQFFICLQYSANY